MRVLLVSLLRYQSDDTTEAVAVAPKKTLISTALDGGGNPATVKAQYNWPLLSTWQCNEAL